MSACRLCKHTETQTVFSHPHLPLFIGTIGENTPKELRSLHLPLTLIQCKNCHLIQQAPDEQLNLYLDRIYSATHDSAVSGTRTGEGEFGKERARNFFQGIQKETLNGKVLEIGCNR